MVFKSWIRPVIGAIAFLGMTLTGYLTWAKFTGQAVSCLVGSPEAASSCQTALDSSYGTLLGVPLTMIGLCAYALMGGLALSPYIIDPVENKSLRAGFEQVTGQGLLVGAIAMTSFSAYLVSILVFELKTFCLYCTISALCSLSFLVLTLGGRSWQNLGRIVLNGLLAAVIIWMGAGFLYAQTPPPITDGRTPIPKLTTLPEPGIGWSVTTSSGAAEIALAEHLTAQGVKMYGAYWCPHCAEQKLLFGKEAFAKIDYVECASQGKNGNPELCREVGIESFPTWQIGDRLISGIRFPEQLAQESGYQGLMEFQYTIPGLYGRF
ncbi:vitamin K epoxide reductase family protein [Spirulina subsalsa FACHB-351]|uniref:Vitamin K epoxide reductase family protein n=1 Tax=Spirulina subsalsa FACHB-351 TaxID=234711 RepID=A0ABT3LA96_9CYAN|nr:vitamin K epoxide reductase family protein [Spirulina subsalsa]MCW6038435.1 vitamin K epoxide reductase family protein [Spirulina subsalsa FACHB-351]